MTGPETSGRIVTFYSYKGGTGRSMALANVAWILANNGLRVLVIDWDLEAPGLHRYFHPFMRDKKLESCEGVIDFLVEFTSAAISPETPRQNADGEPWYRPYANLLSYACSLSWEFPNRGTIDLVSAGRQDAGYPVRVNSFGWQNFYDKLGGGLFLQEVKRQLRQNYDYVLIDSRTGVSDTSGICSVQMPDDLVVCFTLNEQSIAGASAIAASAAAQRVRPDGEMGLRVLPIPTRVDASEKDKLTYALETARERFDTLLQWLDEEQLGEYWGSVHVPYIPYYAYEEVLATIADEPFQRGSMLSAMEEVTRWVTDQTITSLGRQSDEMRLKALGEFVRQPKPKVAPAADYIFYLSYARREMDEGMQRFIGDLVEEVASLTGLPRDEIAFVDYASIQGGDSWRATMMRAMSASRVAVCLVSPSYLNSEEATRERLILQQAGKKLLPVNWVPTSSRNAPGTSVKHGLDEIQMFDGPRDGIRAVMRLSSRQDLYRLSVMELAKRIVELPERRSTNLPMQPLTLLCAIMAERNDSIPSPRRNARPYGRRRRDWSPFWSQQSPSAGRLVQEAAHGIQLPLKLISLHALSDWLARSRKPDGERLLVVADPWTLQQPEHRKTIRELTHHQQVPFALIVCFDTDADTKEYERKLMEFVPPSTVPNTRALILLARSADDLQSCVTRAASHLASTGVPAAQT